MCADGTTPSVRFGLFLSQSRRSWDDVLGQFQMAEELGFDRARSLPVLERIARHRIPELRAEFAASST